MTPPKKGDWNRLAPSSQKRYASEAGSVEKAKRRYESGKPMLFRGEERRPKVLPADLRAGEGKRTQQQFDRAGPPKEWAKVRISPTDYGPTYLIVRKDGKRVRVQGSDLGGLDSMFGLLRRYDIDFDVQSPTMGEV